LSSTRGRDHIPREPPRELVCPSQHHTLKPRGERFILYNGLRGGLSGLYFAQVEQKQLEKRTFLSVPGYDPKEKFEFGVITSFAYPIENSGLAASYLHEWILITNTSNLAQMKRSSWQPRVQRRCSGTLPSLYIPMMIVIR